MSDSAVQSFSEKLFEAVSPETSLDQLALAVLAKEALPALPEGWQLGETEEGVPYYYDSTTQQSHWQHPFMPQFDILAQYYDNIVSAKGEGQDTQQTSTAEWTVYSTDEGAEVCILSLGNYCLTALYQLASRCVASHRHLIALHYLSCLQTPCIALHLVSPCMR
jgi:hypothetical protein